MLNNRLLLLNSGGIDTGVYVQGRIQVPNPMPIFINVPFMDPIRVEITSSITGSANFALTKILTVEAVLDPTVWGKNIYIETQTGGHITNMDISTKHGQSVPFSSYEKYSFILGGGSFAKPSGDFCWIIDLLVSN